MLQFASEMSCHVFGGVSELNLSPHFDTAEEASVGKVLVKLSLLCEFSAIYYLEFNTHDITLTLPQSDDAYVFISWL